MAIESRICMPEKSCRSQRQFLLKYLSLSFRPECFDILLREIGK